MPETKNSLPQRKRGSYGEGGVIERVGIVYNHGRTRHASGTDLANPVGSEAGRFGHNIQRLGRAGSYALSSFAMGMRTLTRHRHLHPSQCVCESEAHHHTSFAMGLRKSICTFVLLIVRDCIAIRSDGLPPILPSKKKYLPRHNNILRAAFTRIACGCHV